MLLRKKSIFRNEKKLCTNVNDEIRYIIVTAMTISYMFMQTFILPLTSSFPLFIHT